MSKKKTQNILIYLGILVFVIAPFTSYLFTPPIIRAYCDANPIPWCGLGWAPILYGGVFFFVFVVGSVAILIATAPKKKK